MKRIKFVSEGGSFQKKRTSGFKWCFVYTWFGELKPEVRTFVRFGGREGFQVKLVLFVSLGFCELLRWTLSSGNAMTRTQRLLVTFTFSPWIVLYEQTNFSFVETKPK